MFCYFMVCFWFVLFVKTHTQNLYFILFPFISAISCYLYGAKYVSMNQTPIYKTALKRNMGATEVQLGCNRSAIGVQ